MNNKKSTRFDLLDGLRGVAAIAVMIYHYGQHNGLHWLGGAWIAVDLFFILSGFVITHSYSRKILEGMTFWRFSLIRLVRLAPLYLLGLMIGLSAIALSTTKANLPHVEITQIFTAAMLGLVFIPYFNEASWPFGDDSIIGAIFPLNDPAWSLFFELFVNALFFLYLHRNRSLPSYKFTFISFVFFSACTLGFWQFNAGWSSENFIFGFPRVIYEFFAGVLIYSLGFHKKRASTLFITFITTTLLLCMLVSNSHITLINIFFLAPMTVALLSSITLQKFPKLICKFLGELSYPLYIIHFPVYRLIHQLFPTESQNPISRILFIGLICVVLSLILVRLDRIIREKITQIIMTQSRITISTKNPISKKPT